jgi:hypothetical protein
VYKIVGITGPKTPSATLSAANQWLGRAVTFQQAPSYTAPGKPFFTGLFSVSPDTSSETIAILSDEHNLFDPAKSAGGQAGYPPLEAQIRSWNPSTIVVAGDLGATTAPRSQIYKGVLVNSLTSVSPGTVRVEIDTATLNGTTNASCPVCIFGDPNNTLPTVGNMVAVDTGANWEWLPITARDATHLTLTFAKPHTAPFKIQAHALAEYSDYFDAGKLFVALGNHDTQNTTDDWCGTGGVACGGAAGWTSSLEAFGATSYTSGKPYYTKTINPHLTLVVSDTPLGLDGTDSNSVQATFLKPTAGLCPTRWCIGVTHYPLYLSCGSGSTYSTGRWLGGAGVDLVVNGHWHRYERDIAPDIAAAGRTIPYITLGAASYQSHDGDDGCVESCGAGCAKVAAWDGCASGHATVCTTGHRAAAKVTVSNSQLIWEEIDDTGAVVDTFTLVK